MKCKKAYHSPGSKSVRTLSTFEVNTVKYCQTCFCERQKWIFFHNLIIKLLVTVVELKKKSWTGVKERNIPEKSFMLYHLEIPESQNSIQLTSIHTKVF